MAETGKINPGGSFRERTKAPQRQRITDAKALDQMLKLTTARTERLQKISEERKRLWIATRDFCQAQGAALVSVPFHSPLRIVVELNSPIPVQIKAAGYRVSHFANETRVTSEGIKTVDVLKVDLGAHDEFRLY